MTAVSASFTAKVLDVWERGGAQPPALKALTLLAWEDGESPVEDLARLSVGQRDGRLLRMREHLFGPRVNGLTNCPVCEHRVEVEFTVQDVLVPNAVEDASPMVFEDHTCEVRFRQPNCEDLLQLQNSDAIDQAKAKIFEACVFEARMHREPISASELPPGVRDQVIKMMADADPQADIELSVSCPNCGHGWVVPFDILAFLWDELHAWALSMVRAIHALASAYGWSEAQILSLSQTRRDLYLRMVSA
jgi:hypothetical protein